MSEKTGQTKDAGWELGVRTTVAAPAPVVWQYLMGEGLATWLGDIATLPTKKGATYATADGVAGTILSYTEGQRVKLTWRPDDWPHDSTLRVSVKQSVIGTTIDITHDGLANRDERKMMLGHWKNITAAFDKRFG